MRNQKEYKGFRDLIVYQLCYQLAVEVHNETKKFPKEEKYALIDQIRRSARAMPAMIAEAWSRRRYPKSFVSKLIDADGEASETTVWLDFAKDFAYLEIKQYKYFMEKYNEVSPKLYSMINQPEKFCY